MSTAFRLKTFPEIVANMFARVQALFGEDVDLNVGSVFRTIFETAALSDAEQYVQIAKLLDLRSLDVAKGDDLDNIAKAYGSDIFTDLRRRAANTSISQITVGDGVLLVDAVINVDVLADSPTFTVFDGSLFPTSGAASIDFGTAQSEIVIFTRSANTFTVVLPTTGLLTSHQVGARVIHVSIRSILAAGIAIAAVSATLATGTGASWGTSGNVIFDRSTVNEELRPFTRVGDVLTFAATTFAHVLGSVVIQSTFGSNRAIAAGSTAFVPATEATKQINYSATLAGTLLDGDFSSDLIAVESTTVGLETRAGSNSITRWLSPPFANATVTNPIAATRGVDREDDDTYRQRIKDFVQSLTRATPLALTTLVSGLQDPTTGEIVAFAEIIEPVSPGTSFLYITDGTSTFGLDQDVFLGRDVLIRDAEADDARGRLGAFGPFAYSTTVPVTPRLFKSVNRGVATSVGVDYLEDTGQAMVVNAFVGRFLKTDDDQFYLIASNTVIRFNLTPTGATPSLGAYSIFNFAVAPLVPGTDFAFNEATGDLELAVPLVEHDGLVAASDGASPSVGAYTFTTGLGAYVQRVINGDPTDFIDFPGLRAAGTKVVVKVPTTISPTLTIKVVPGRGFSDAQVAPSVQSAVQTSINALGIGENITLSEIIRVVKELPGIDDVVFISPTANITIASSQIARITTANVVVV